MLFNLDLPSQLPGDAIAKMADEIGYKDGWKKVGLMFRPEVKYEVIDKKYPHLMFNGGDIAYCKVMRWFGDEEGYRAIGEFLANNSSIQRLLCLDFIRDVTAQSMEGVVRGLKRNSTLQYLEVSGLAKGASSVVFSSLAQNQIKITRLIIESILAKDHASWCLRSRATSAQNL
jgi:hypothetical protein